MKKLGALLAFYFLFATQALAGVTCTLPFTLTNGTTADATQVMANYNALVACFTQAAANGVNNDITQLTGLSTALNPSEGGSNVFVGGTSTGTANAQVVAVTIPAGFALTNGWRVIFKAGFTNTGATQLNVNGTGLTNVTKPSSAGVTALTGGEIIVGTLIQAVYDGTQFELIPTQANGGFGAVPTLASAATTDLGTVGSHYAQITGTATITSFGSTATTAFPNYNVCFTGAATITYNATSLIVPGAQNITTAANDCANLLYLGSGNWQVTQYTRATFPPPSNFAPNIGVSIGTSGTYNTPTSGGFLPLYLRVRMCGGGGGGGALNTNAGGNGNGSNFGSWTVGGGNGGGVTAGGGGAGGSGGSNSTGTLILRVSGGSGNAGDVVNNSPSGAGGNSFIGGAAGAVAANNAGAAAATGSCAGGSGAGGTAGNGSSAGGGAGEYVEFIITSPATAYGFSAGTGGNGGAAGGAAGGNGGSGRIDVVAYWQ